MCLPREYTEGSNSNFGYICKVPQASAAIAEYSKEQVRQVLPRVRVWFLFMGRKGGFDPFLHLLSSLPLSSSQLPLR